MKYLATLLFFMYIFSTCKPTSVSDSSTDMVSFTTVFNSKSATKDGYYLEGYVVVIQDDVAKTLEGKKIKVTGKYHVVKGIGEQPNKNGEISQGREEDTKHIANPKIEVAE